MLSDFFRGQVYERIFLKLGGIVDTLVMHTLEFLELYEYTNLGVIKTDVRQAQNDGGILSVRRDAPKHPIQIFSKITLVPST